MEDSIIWPPMHYQSLLSSGDWEDYTGSHDIQSLIENARDSRAALLEQPNIFQFATSELSQDAFLCWLMSWCEQPFQMHDRALNEASIDFISIIFNLHKIPVPNIDSIEITRQFESLDILAIVNNKYAILVEDKTFTKDHSNQLMRYRDAVKKEYPALIQLPIYYKISDQSHYRSPESAGYIPFKRKMMLEILKRGIKNGVQHPIFVDYYRHLQQLENKISAFRSKPIEEWDAFAWQGFYQELQKEINGNWGYVSNKKGGFWGFWWKSAMFEPYSLQLEQRRLCVKMKAAEIEDKVPLRSAKKALKYILESSENRDLFLQKPSRLRTGKTMTIAERDNYLYTKSDGTIDMDRIIEELKKY
ncbi:PD-(D/E)XK nuclease family protein [Cytobacillus praedii]